MLMVSWYFPPEDNILRFKSNHEQERWTFIYQEAIFYVSLGTLVRG